MYKNIFTDRKIVIDIETTGMNKSGKIYKGHRIIEIGAIEILNREITGNNFHVYINPHQKIDLEAQDIHRISNEFLIDKPNFNDIYDDLIKFIDNSEIIAHNSIFDISFINYEISKINNTMNKISEICKITDTLKIARYLHPGKKNNLYDLCKRYHINIDKNKLHSALFDAHILAKLYLLMTSKQKKIIFNNLKSNYFNKFSHKKNKQNKKKLIVIQAQHKELKKHISYLKYMKNKNNCLWMNKVFSNHL